MRSFHFSTLLGTRLMVIVAIALLVLIVAISVFHPVSRWIPAQQWGAMLAAAGVRGMGIFFVVSVLATSIGLPRQMVAFIAGLAYGFWTGVFLSLLAALLGCYLSVRVSRRFLARWVARCYPRFVAQLQRLLQNDIVIKVIALRLQPFGTNLLTNVCVGFLQVPLDKFIAATAVGYVPQMMVFSLLGSGVRVGSSAQTLLSVVLLGISMGLGAVLVKRHRLRSLR